MKTVMLGFAIAMLLVFLLLAAGCLDGKSDSHGGSDEVIDDDDDDVDDGATINASVKVNPVCSISCIVTWNTDQPADSWVRFGENGTTYQIGSADMVTEHKVIVIGMHAQTSYKMQARSTTANGDVLVSGELHFDAGHLPGSWFTSTVDVNDETRTAAGWTIANIVRDAGGPFAQIRAAIFDMDGEAVWFYEHETYGQGRGDIQILMNEQGNVTIGPGVPLGERMFEMNLAGEIVWEGLEQPFSPQGIFHHVFHPIGNGEYITTSMNFEGQLGADLIKQFNRDLEITWTWNAFEHLDFDPDDGFFEDWTHVNSIAVDLEENVTYVNSYHLNAMYKIDRATGEVIWTVGEDGDFSPDPMAQYPWFANAHSFDPLGDGLFLVYDNGTQLRARSRAIMYRLDEQTMESTLVWEYDGDSAADGWFNFSFGDVDMLDNGNVLITAGNEAQGWDPTRLIEVTADGEKVWQLWLDKGVSVYQAERFAPLAKAID